MKRWLLNQLVALDLAVNATLLFGSPYETVSERCYRRGWKIPCKVIDTVFGLFGEVEHCKNSAEGNEAQYEIL